MARTAPTEQRTASDLLDEARAAIRPRRLAVVEGLPEPLRRVAGYHAGLWDAEGSPQVENGKAVRPALVLACAGAVGGPEAVEAAVPAAVAVELVHEFTLLHDDVMDGDATRRGRAAAWTVFGTAQALLTGNALLAEALRCVDAGECAAVLVDAVLELCAGQAADLAESGKPSAVLIDAVLHTAELKTGALFGAACELGARAAGAADPADYRAFGRLLGRAFQLVDDVLDISGDPSAPGTPASRAPATVRCLAPVVWALTEARRLTDAALVRLEHADPHPRGAADLRLLASALVDRVT